MIMRPSKTDNSQADLFRNRLTNQLDPRHEMIVLSNLIPWEELEAEFAEMHIDSVSGGQPPKPVRLMVGLLLLQYLHNLSDEKVTSSWVENPYWQFFCGYDYLQWELPIDPSSLSRWRGRLGKERIEKILGMTIKVAVKSGVVSKKDLETVIIDTTVMPKNIEFPTDSKLLNKARMRLIKLAKKSGAVLRQNYNKVAKNLMRQIGGYLHAKQMKRAKSAIKKLKTKVGRVVRDCERKVKFDDIFLKEQFRSELSKAKALLQQGIKSKNKLYSLHEPHVECISKGKAHKRYEFGVKVSLSLTHKKRGIITGSEALLGNPYDGHTLDGALNLSEKLTGVKPKRGFVDKGYRGHTIEDTEIFISGQRKGVTDVIRKQLKRRQAIEPHIGHMKMEGKLGRCRLHGIQGDQINAIMVAASYNLRLILNHLRIIFVQILYQLTYKKFTQKFLLKKNKWQFFELA